MFNNNEQTVNRSKKQQCEFDPKGFHSRKNLCFTPMINAVYPNGNGHSCVTRWEICNFELSYRTSYINYLTILDINSLFKILQLFLSIILNNNVFQFNLQRHRWILFMLKKKKWELQISRYSYFQLNHWKNLQRE